MSCCRGTLTLVHNMVCSPHPGRRHSGSCRGRCRNNNISRYAGEKEVLENLTVVCRPFLVFHRCAALPVQARDCEIIK
jgi:hypothetical protein